MNRRNFITILGLGAGSAVFSSALTSCSDLDTRLDYGWNGPKPDIKDIRLQVLAYAILCPNPHNKQPWIVRLIGPTSIELYVDPNRLLPATDPFFRQIHIGQGTFLETLSIAATGLGYHAQINYFPQGMYNNTELRNKPVASISLIKQDNNDRDPLFAQLLRRHSNKREYDNLPLTPSHVSELRESHGSSTVSELTLVQSPDAKLKLEQVLTSAMQIEVGNKNRDMETIDMFRFNEDELEKYRDGFGVAQAGLSGVKKFFVENFILSRESVEKDASAFGEQAVEMTQKTAASTATFAWLSTITNTRLDQVKVGREYCRINLKTTAMGLAQHPMSQVLQEYEEMKTLQTTFKNHFNIGSTHTVQMLFRLGKAEATTHGPRREVKSIIDA